MSQALFLHINELNFNYGDKKILQNFKLELHQGEILCIMGPSGCGKTTLLRLLAGLEHPQGSNSNPITWESGHRPVRTGMAFQEPRLLPWRSIEQNLLAGISALPLAEKHHARSLIGPLLAALGIEGILHQFPDQLSGGMRQRVSLVRALLFGKELQLWDEPFQSLDGARRNMCLQYVRQLWKASQTSAIVVTHDSAEAQELGDRVITLS